MATQENDQPLYDNETLNQYESLDSYQSKPDLEIIVHQGKDNRGRNTITVCTTSTPLDWSSRQNTIRQWFTDLRKKGKNKDEAAMGVRHQIGRYFGDWTDTYHVSVTASSN